MKLNDIRYLFMVKTLLSTLLLFITITPLLAQVTTCLPAKDDVWIDKRTKLRHYVNRTIFIFETEFNDTVSVIVDKKLVTRRYMETTSAGAVIGSVVVPRPSTGEVVIKTNNGTCTQFCLKDGYLYAYIRVDSFGKWLITYSNYERIYY